MVSNTSSLIIWIQDSDDLVHIVSVQLVVAVLQFGGDLVGPGEVDEDAPVEVLPVPAPLLTRTQRTLALAPVQHDLQRLLTIKPGHRKY